jgi:hypothetical protein
MKYRVALLAVAAFLATSVSATAATFTGLQGDVTVNRGRGFQQASTGSQVQPGDRVMLKQQSYARITYDNGCTILLEQPGLYDVPTDPVCDTPVVIPLALGAGVAIGLGIYFATKDNSSSP